MDLSQPQVTARRFLSQFNQYSRISVTPMPGAIGAEVQCGDVRHIDDEIASEIRRAWFDHLALFFRGQQLTDDDLLHFTSRFGDPEDAPTPAPEVKKQKYDHPYIAVISNVIENGSAIGALGNDEAVWHSDMSYNPMPPSASLLYALEVPPAGGETGVSNMYQALETLPADLRARLNGLTILHDGGYDATGRKRGDSKSASHPVVRTHPETGCNALYLGRRPYARINELPPDESEALLNTLWDHAKQPQFSWHHSWRVGDILVWDNRCTMHHRNAFDPTSRRIMHRGQVKGSPPIAPTLSAKPHPRHSLRAS